MEKVCGFCMSLSPIVYCEADAAHLCLLCDVKVHSANTLSSRHPRALLCQVCKHRLASVRCNDHNKFICRDCDFSLHKNKSQHQKKMVRTYLGCPSAMDFASLWGFEMNQVEYCGLEIPKYRFGKQVRGSVLSSKLGVKSEVGPSSQHTEVYRKDSQNKNISSILQQIIDLEKFQLCEANNASSFIRAKQQSNVSASIYNTSWKLDKSLQHPLNVEPFTSSFPPLEDLTSSSIDGNALHGEPFWECESRDHDFEMWSENIQGLGICEESAFFDNCNIPDVDVSFRNYEELFECDEGIDTALFDEKELMISSMENNTSLGKVDHSYAKGIEDISTASSKSKTVELEGKGRSPRRYKQKKNAKRLIHLSFEKSEVTLVLKAWRKYWIESMAQIQKESPWKLTHLKALLEIGKRLPNVCIIIGSATYHENNLYRSFKTSTILGMLENKKKRLNFLKLRQSSRTVTDHENRFGVYVCTTLSARRTRYSYEVTKRTAFRHT